MTVLPKSPLLQAYIFDDADCAALLPFSKDWSVCLQLQKVYCYSVRFESIKNYDKIPSLQ